jgi:hypothetical protein
VARNYYLKILAGNECPYCDGPKQRGYAFCYDCYFSLPKDLKNGLYRKIGQGFEEAVDEALGWMEVWGT